MLKICVMNTRAPLGAMTFTISLGWCMHIGISCPLANTQVKKVTHLSVLNAYVIMKLKEKLKEKQLKAILPNAPLYSCPNDSTSPLHI